MAPAPDIAAPAGLDPWEKEEFERLAGELRARGLIDRADVRLIEMAACTAILLKRARRDVKQEGMSTVAANGTPMPHPMLAVVRTSTQQLKGLLNSLGLTPTSSKLGTRDPKAEATSPDDPWARTLNVIG